MRRQTNLKIRFLTLITTLIFTCLHITYAGEVSVAAPEKNMPQATKSGLQFEQTLKSPIKTNANSKESNTPSKTDLRIKLRMSRSIHDFESLNKALQEVEVISNIPALKEASRIADEATKSSGGIVIEGDRMQVHMGRTMSAIGNASLTKEKQTVTGDRIEYDTQNSM
ncbi:MAG: LPS-assembly protein LptD, partial [Pseudomonadota bacterium]